MEQMIKKFLEKTGCDFDIDKHGNTMSDRYSWFVLFAVAVGLFKTLKDSQFWAKSIRWAEAPTQKGLP